MESIEAIAGDLHTIRDWVRFGTSAFKEAGLVFGHGTEDAFDEALALTLHALHLDHAIARECFDARITAVEAADVHDLFARRIDERIPAAYLTHEARFAGLDFYVDKRVVIPRSPIAELIEQRFEPWVEAGEVGRILDLCCGSGCIGIACALAFPEAEVTLADRDTAALEVARRNVGDYELDARAKLVASDLFAGLGEERFDLIVCNPPYVAKTAYEKLPAEYCHEPRAGLESGPEGLDHPLAILAGAAGHLTSRGVLVLEVGLSRPAFEHALPRLETVWAELERGGEGVALITRAALAAPGALRAAA